MFAHPNDIFIQFAHDIFVPRVRTRAEGFRSPEGFKRAATLEEVQELGPVAVLNHEGPYGSAADDAKMRITVDAEGNTRKGTTVEDNTPPPPPKAIEQTYCISADREILEDDGSKNIVSTVITPTMTFPIGSTYCSSGIPFAEDQYTTPSPINTVYLPDGEMKSLPAGATFMLKKQYIPAAASQDTVYESPHERPYGTSLVSERDAGNTMTARTTDGGFVKIPYIDDVKMKICYNNFIDEKKPINEHLVEIKLPSGEKKTFAPGSIYCTTSPSENAVEYILPHEQKEFVIVPVGSKYVLLPNPAYRVSTIAASGTTTTGSTASATGTTSATCTTSATGSTSSTTGTTSSNAAGSAAGTTTGNAAGTTTGNAGTVNTATETGKTVGEMVGIFIGIVFFAFIMIGGGVLWYKRMKKNQPDEEVTGGNGLLFNEDMYYAQY